MSTQNGAPSQANASSSDWESFKKTIAEYLNDTDIIHAKHKFMAISSLLLILTSIAILIVETVQSLDPGTLEALKALDRIIMIIFTVEYLLKIMTASLGFGKDNLKGWRGSWRYVTSFYGLIDLAAIFPFYLAIFSPSVHLGYLRIFRLLRVILLGRFFKSFHLIRRAVVDKKSEIIVSIQVVAVLTVILSVIMYEIEHTAQPEVFRNIPSTLAWSVSKYIREIGGFGKESPVTPEGKIIATLIGFLGIALFALPAGIIASGFVHEIDEDKKKGRLEEKRKRLVQSFRDVRNRWLDIPVPRRHITMVQAKSRLNMHESDIIDIAERHEGIRLRYKRVNETDSNPSALLIEQFDNNTSYGTLASGTDNHITVICPTSYDETSIGHFSLCVARLLGATYISNELFGTDDSVDPEAACSFENNRHFDYIWNDWAKRGNAKPADVPRPLQDFLHDIYAHTTGGSLAIIVMTNSDDSSVVDNHSNPYHDLKYPYSNIELALKTLEDSATQNFYVRSRGKSATGLHAHLERNTPATIISLFISPALLEWGDLNSYFTTMKEIADAILRHNLKPAGGTMTQHSVNGNGMLSST